jgi:hypothetical protein
MEMTMSEQERESCFDWWLSQPTYAVPQFSKALCVWKAAQKEQATEIEALRGFARKIQDNLINADRLYIYDALAEFRLIDENSKPTVLLTGAKE